ncbi:hypothetical protein [Listeria fleischmannii]|uniref:hypothetical protein n=1 Tax=Listeria fleischmannii TaxID=1069827 RepID=UPI0020B77F64|nr:hypothetical protein [Listeria fleischmannii]
MKKGAVALVAFNVLASTALTAIPATVSAAESTSAQTRSTIVTPVNTLKNPGFTPNPLGFDDWIPAYNDQVITGGMSKDNSGSFIFGDGSTVKPITGGVSIWSYGAKGTLTQKVHVIKGETYRLSGNVRDAGGLLDAAADFYLKIGDSEVRKAAKDMGGAFQFDIVAPITGEVSITIGMLRGGNIGVNAATMELTNLAFKNY